MKRTPRKAANIQKKGYTQTARFKRLAERYLLEDKEYQMWLKNNKKAS